MSQMYHPPQEEGDIETGGANTTPNTTTSTSEEDAKDESNDETNNNDDTCAICLAPLEDRIVTSSCVHTFHAPCLADWFGAQAKRAMKKQKKSLDLSCPTCRQEFLSPLVLVHGGTTKTAPE